MLTKFFVVLPIFLIMYYPVTIRTNNCTFFNFLLHPVKSKMTIICITNIKFLIPKMMEIQDSTILYSTLITSSFFFIVIQKLTVPILQRLLSVTETVSAF